MVGIKISLVLSGSGELLDPKTYATFQKLSDAAKDAYHLTPHFITPSKYSTLIDSGVDPKIITAFMTNEDADNLPKTLPPRRPKVVAAQPVLTSQMTIAALVRAKVPAADIPKFEADARNLLQERLKKAAHTVAVDTPVKEPPAKRAKNQ